MLTTRRRRLAISIALSCLLLLCCAGLPAYAASTALKVETALNETDLTVNISLKDKEPYAGVEFSIVVSDGLTYVSHEFDPKFTGLYQYNGTRHLLGGMTTTGENEYSGTLDVCVLKLQYKGSGKEKITIVPAVSRYDNSGMPVTTKLDEHSIEITRSASQGNGNGVGNKDVNIDVVIDSVGAANEQPGMFSDIKGHWAAGYIQSLAAQHYISGVGNGKFDPSGKLTRAAIVQMLYNAFGEGVKAERPLAFADTVQGAWYQDAIAWAVDHELVTGYNERKFGPNDPISRQDFTVIMARLAVLYEVELSDPTALKAFSDDQLISGYAKDAVYQLYSNAIISGKGNNKFDPRGHTTRAEAAKMMYLLLDKAGMIDEDYKV